jgi:hypothetical protein
LTTLHLVTTPATCYAIVSLAAVNKAQQREPIRVQTEGRRPFTDQVVAGARMNDVKTPASDDDIHAVSAFQHVVSVGADDRRYLAETRHRSGRRGSDLTSPHARNGRH